MLNYFLLYVIIEKKNPSLDYIVFLYAYACKILLNFKIVKLPITISSITLKQKKKLYTKYKFIYAN